MVGADAEKETRKLALWPGPAEANRGERLGREYDVVDEQTKGARYTAETQYSGRFAMEVRTRPHGRIHGGVMVLCRSRKVARSTGGLLPGRKSKKEFIAKPRGSQEIEAGLRGTRRREQKAGNWREARDDISNTALAEQDGAKTQRRE